MAVPRPLQTLLALSALAVSPAPAAQAHRPAQASPAAATVAELVSGFRARAKALEGTSGMRLGYRSLQSAFGLPADGSGIQTS